MPSTPMPSDALIVAADETFYNARGLSRTLAISFETITKACADGELRAKLINGDWIISGAAIRAWLEGG